jgi:hypothetical protein
VEAKKAEEKVPPKSNTPVSAGKDTVRAKTDEEDDAWGGLPSFLRRK